MSHTSSIGAAASSTLLHFLSLQGESKAAIQYSEQNMSDHKNDGQKQWDIVLPGEAYMLQQWLVRNGSAVQPGDKLAIAVRKGATSASTSASTSEAAVVKHKRPKKRMRGPEEAAPSNTKSVVKKLSAYLPPAQDVVTIVAPAAGVLRIEDYSLSNKIGSIVPCQHPAIIGGLCVVCGASIGPQPEQSQSSFAKMPSAATTSTKTMSQVTVSGGVTMTISEAEAQQMSKQTSQRLLEQSKLSLVLDLDHTLVHATADERARNHYGRRQDVRTLILPVMIEPPQVHWVQHFVKLRPHVEEFLSQAQNLYEISVYTAGTRTYAEQVCLLLSRDIVGATHDDVELLQMKYQVTAAEQELFQKKLLLAESELAMKKANLAESKAMVAEYNETNKNANEKRAAAENKSDESTTVKSTSKEEANDDTFVPEKEPETEQFTNGVAATVKDTDFKKKKSVSFGEPPKDCKTDEMTSETLERLKKELQEAEALEQKALEVRQQIFGSRIVSRTDVGDLGRDVKSLERIFPCGGSMAVIVDDREDVWANAQDNSKTSGEPPENLLLIRPYHWKPFLGFADVNNAAGEDISGESLTTEDEEDCALLWTLDILKRMHARFYSTIKETGNHDITVPPLLRKMRQEVLSGCTLVYSGLIPLHQQNRTSQSPRPSVVRYGESLGARVSRRCHLF